MSSPPSPWRCRLFHLYAAVAGAWPFGWAPIISTQPLRYAHVAFVLLLSFLLFPIAAAVPQPHPLVGRRRRADRRRHPGLCSRAATISPTARRRRPRSTSCSARSSSCCCWRRRAAQRAGSCRSSSLAFLAYACSGLTCRRPGPIAATRRPLVGQLYMTLEGIFGVAGRRVVDPDHPVHDLRRVPAAFRRRASSSSTSRSR